MTMLHGMLISTDSVILRSPKIFVSIQTEDETVYQLLSQMKYEAG
jgi:hypothetical protein